MSARVGMSVTLARIRAGEIAEVLVIMLRTLAPAVTHVCHVQTDSGATTAVEARAGGVFTLMLVLVAWTVIDIVTT